MGKSDQRKGGTALAGLDRDTATVAVPSDLQSSAINESPEERADREEREALGK